MILLPDFRPHFNFDESYCAYLGDERYGIRTMVDFQPIGGGPPKILLITNDAVVVHWNV